ncbi:hypothetical protein BT69DRAFT_1386151 [Atractiella rhizophila]|nr:hypothetical protein BT69DRAFT_1386151 [Atractiella rhizophila]
MNLVTVTPQTCQLVKYAQAVKFEYSFSSPGSHCADPMVLCGRSLSAKYDAESARTNCPHFAVSSLELDFLFVPTKDDICNVSALPTLTCNVTPPAVKKFQGRTGTSVDVVLLTELLELEQYLILEFEHFSVEDLENGYEQDIPNANLMASPLQSLRRIAPQWSMWLMPSI